MFLFAGNDHVPACHDISEDCLASTKLQAAAFGTYLDQQILIVGIYKDVTVQDICGETKYFGPYAGPGPWSVVLGPFSLQGS